MMLQALSGWVRVVTKDAAKNKMEEMAAKQAEEMDALRDQEEQLRDEQAEEMAAGLKRRVEQRMMLQALSGPERRGDGGAARA
eukprot:3528409-Amphidinium_carterae.1